MQTFHSCRKRKISLLICLLFLTGMTTQVVGSTRAENSVNNVTVDERLWATWGLETVEITTDNSSKTYTLADLLADKNLLSENLFLSLYFFEHRLGATSSQKEFVYEFDINVKGSFSTDNGHLTITLYEQPPLTFVYAIENDRLNIHYTQGNRQYHLIYKPVL